MPRLRLGRGALVAFVLVAALAPAAPAARPGLPVRLADDEYWRMIREFSEPGGFFRSDNLVSNEDTYQSVIRELQTAVRPGGVYLGVGPDQNFTYIAALQPKIAFIADIRRGNLHVHLMYKALFELADDRVEFLSRLFARPRPAGLSAASSADQLLTAFAMERPSRELYAANLQDIIALLRTRHQFGIDTRDEQGIEYVMSAFFFSGPAISYSNAGGRGRYPSFQDLQTAADGDGVQRGYLASEANYRTVRSLQQRNLVVPLVGDFAGPKAIRAVGAFVRSHGGTVTAFYTSNVEQYLFQDGVWGSFAANLAALPLDGSSTIIRSCFNDNCASGPSRSSVLLDPIGRLLKDVEAGLISSYSDVLAYRR
jgi:hypothetical protein